MLSSLDSKLANHPTFNTFFRNKCEIKLTHPSKSGKLFLGGLFKGVCHYLADYAGCCRIGQIPLYPKEMFMCLFKIVKAYKHVSQFFAKCLFTKHSKRLENTMFRYKLFLNEMD